MGLYRRVAGGEVDVVVASEDILRGIDLPAHALGAVVICKERLPDAQAYVHLAGRTARMGSAGAVVSLISERSLQQVKVLERCLAITIQKLDFDPAQEVQCGPR